MWDAATALALRPTEVWRRPQGGAPPSPFSPWRMIRMLYRNSSVVSSLYPYLAVGGSILAAAPRDSEEVRIRLHRLIRAIADCPLPCDLAPGEGVAASAVEGDRSVRFDACDGADVVLLTELGALMEQVAGKRKMVTLADVRGRRHGAVHDMPHTSSTTTFGRPSRTRGCL
jgi:hypothetical protein